MGSTCKETKDLYSMQGSLELPAFVDGPSFVVTYKPLDKGFKFLDDYKGKEKTSV